MNGFASEIASTYNSERSECVDCGAGVSVRAQSLNRIDMVQ